MLEIEGICTYESSQPTSTYILFPFSTGSTNKSYHDLNKESLPEEAARKINLNPKTLNWQQHTEKERIKEVYVTCLIMLLSRYHTLHKVPKPYWLLGTLAFYRNNPNQPSNVDYATAISHFQTICFTEQLLQRLNNPFCSTHLFFFFLLFCYVMLCSIMFCCIVMWCYFPVLVALWGCIMRIAAQMRKQKIQCSECRFR